MPADSNSEITMQPQPTEKQSRVILEAIAEYLTVKVCFPAAHAALLCIHCITHAAFACSIPRRNCAPLVYNDDFSTCILGQCSLIVFFELVLPGPVTLHVSSIITQH